MSNVKTRSNLSADGLFKLVKSGFSAIADHRKSNASIPLGDALMSAFAMFSLKYPSLLLFDKEVENDNLKTLYGIGKIPSDTQMRTVLDEVDPGCVRALFVDVFRELQRGKALEPYVYMDGSYLLSIDGTGYFSSNEVHCASCLEKKHKKTGKVSYSHQMLGAVIVHPKLKEVIPFAPEPIVKQDGENKNDCERNACKRFFDTLRKEHPHLSLTIIEDALSSNAPHIHEIVKHNMHYILGVKEGDHQFLFENIAQEELKGAVSTFEMKDLLNPAITHKFRFYNQTPLNESNQDLLINFLEYWQSGPKNKAIHFSWVTDFTITKENACEIMQGGRARWKIENETFNTLKNQEYNFEHNYGHGKKNLSVVLAQIMMLAFLVDQTQQLCCPLFRATWKHIGSKISLWWKIRSLFDHFILTSMQQLYEGLLYGFKKSPLMKLDSS
jgi:hypothetical protein